MADLLDQLRAYGRQIEADHGLDAAEGTAPAEGTVSAESEGGGREPFPQARSHRSAVALVAATIAAVALTASLLFPAASPEGGSMNNKSSGLALGICLFAAGCTSTADGTDAGVAGRPSAAATSSATADATPGLFDGTPDIAPGTYGFDLQGVPMQITVPAGWVRHDDFWLTAGPEETSDGFVSFLDVTDVFKDPCDWSAGTAGIGPTVDDLVAGFQAEIGLQTSVPKPLNVDGFTGTELVFTTPADLDVSKCHTGTFALFNIEVPGTLDRQIGGTAGGTGTLWILDLNGKRGVISFAADQPTSTTSAQIQDMLGSLRIG